jgi:manganese/zinc/iron transport system permease protein
MIREFFQQLSRWDMSIDTWTVVTAALAAMACALPGVFLVVRRQSMMGDALSHTTLPGIVGAFLFAHYLSVSGWISSDVYDAWRHAAMFVGAMSIGVFSAVLTEWVQKQGRVESSAALGVVFTTLFAVGLLSIRLLADSVHIDPDCVLYGNIETVVLDLWPGTTIPRAAVVNGAALLANLALVGLFFKELRISAFDPALATTMGINARWMHYGLMAITAATLVSAFESVGSILVIAMLIVPAATAHLLTDRLSGLIGLSLVVAVLSAVIGHVLAITVPAIVFSRLGFDTVVDASTAGMVAVAGGMLFVAAIFLGPRHGIVSKFVHRTRLRLRIAAEDILGQLYRSGEKQGGDVALTSNEFGSLAVSGFVSRLALWQLTRAGDLSCVAAGYCLTRDGKRKAEQLVRSHRLWETYVAKHFELPDDHLHQSANWVEHFIDPMLRGELFAELSEPSKDPHGTVIPHETEVDTAADSRDPS